MSRLTRTRDGIEPPFTLPCICIVGVHKSTNAVLTTRYSQDHEVFNNERCKREAVSELVVHGRHIPDHAAGLRIECDDVGVQCAEKHFVTQNRNATIYPPATWTNITRQLTLVKPDWPPGVRLQRKNSIIWRGTVENSVDHNGCGLELPSGSGLKDPLRHQRTDIPFIHLIESAEPMSGI